VSKQLGTYEGLEAKSGTSKAGKPWTMFSAKIAGKKYGLGFSNKLVEGLKVGSYVEFEASQSPRDLRYFDLQSIEVSAAIPPVAGTVVESSVVPSGTQKNDYQQIDRRVALQVAGEVVNAAFNNPNSKKNPSLLERVNQVVAYADHFFNYIQTGSSEPLNLEDVKKLADAVVEPVE